MRCPRCQHANPRQAQPSAWNAEDVWPRPALPVERNCQPVPSSATGAGHRWRGKRQLNRASPRPRPNTPKHLAEKILTSKSAIEGERKQVTILFAGLKGSMELLADRDPEEARKILDQVLERMMEAVHRYEGTVKQVMGDGIMALFGAPSTQWT